MDFGKVFNYLLYIVILVNVDLLGLLIRDLHIQAENSDHYLGFGFIRGEIKHLSHAGSLISNLKLSWIV